MLADLILPAYIHHDQAFCLETYRISLKIQLAQKANRQKRERVNAVAAAELL